MSDSESDALSSANLPDDKTLEKALRNAVATIYRSGKMEELTVRRVRSAAEKALDLEEGFFKGYEAWKSRSDKIIKDEVEAQEDHQEENDVKPTPKVSRKPPIPKKTKSTKGASTANAEPTRKKRKKSTPPASEEELSSVLSDVESPSSVSDDGEIQKSPVSKKAAKTAKKPKRTRTPSKQIEDSASEADEIKQEGKDSNQPEIENVDASESGMSVVLDKEPPPKRKRKEPVAKSSSAKAKKPASSKDANLDPDQAEIKRLQGWLIKCGIRKMWFRELAPFDTPKAKIRHLKEMLSEAGMQGRYSVDKAKAIREARELKADLEMVQEGAKRWGKREEENSEEDEEEEADKGRPRRRLARGFKSLDFLDDDGEESD